MKTTPNLVVKRRSFRKRDPSQQRSQSVKQLKFSKNPYEYFSVASDILVIRCPKGKKSKALPYDVLLIQRRYPPHQGAWALPGGFVDRDEDAITAAMRELFEETGLKAKRFFEFGTFSHPKRDPRGRTLSVCFYTIYKRSLGTPRGGDDASHVQWFPINKLPQLAFDHKEMIQRGMKTFFRELGLAKFS